MTSSGERGGSKRSSIGVEPDTRQRSLFKWMDNL
jgi:hypothetical protein